MSANVDPRTHGFAVMPAKAFLADPLRVPDQVGVYLILLRGGKDLAAATGYEPEASRPYWEVWNRTHVYTGETYGLRSRLRQHLAGTVKESNLRLTLLALQHAHGALWPEDAGAAPHIVDLEGRLSALLSAGALIAFKQCRWVRDVEDDVLRRSASPLNIRGVKGHAYVRALRRMRRAFNTRYISGKGLTDQRTGFPS